MTLADFLRDTAEIPCNTEILWLNPMGNLEPAAFLTRDDLPEDDTLRDDLAECGDPIVITGEAN